jgi:hypothetical protein
MKVRLGLWPEGEVIKNFYRWWAEKNNIAEDILEKGLAILDEAMNSADITPWVIVDDNNRIDGVLFVNYIMESDKIFAELRVAAVCESIADKYQFAKTMQDFYNGFGMTFRIGG